MNLDPFAQYMAHWIPSVGHVDAFESYLAKMRQEARAAAYVMPDIAPFRSNDGAQISGRAAWREHLKATGLVELGISDIKAGRERWEQRKKNQSARVRGENVDVTHEVPIDFRPSAPSRLQIEIANRLHGRPAPDRKSLVRLVVEQAKRMKRG